MTIARNEYKYVADVEVVTQPVPLVTCSVRELNQVFLNIIINAAHAITDLVKDSGARGTIKVATRHDGEHSGLT